MLLKLLFAHSLGDYFLQTDYLAMNKGRDNYILCIHAILYTLAVGLIFRNEISHLWYWVILLSHIPVDYIKARGITPNKFGDKNALILDQAIHYLILVLALIF
ncbi:DUF3307 domain-containing protein [Terrisporobacter mayombei]|nr:DUF3307 domain-containing protein [Terrisporobacter mayombei]